MYILNKLINKLEYTILLAFSFTYLVDSELAARTTEENKQREKLPKSTFLRNLLSLVKKLF